MRYLVVPPLVTLRNLAGDELNDETGAPAAVSFSQFTLSRLTDLLFALEGMDGALAVVAISKELVRAAPGSVLLLDDAHWHLLARATKRPTPNPSGLIDPYYSPVILHNMVPYMKAICEASDRVSHDQTIGAAGT